MNNFLSLNCSLKSLLHPILLSYTTLNEIYYKCQRICSNREKLDNWKYIASRTIYTYAIAPKVFAFILNIEPYLQNLRIDFFTSCYIHTYRWRLSVQNCFEGKLFTFFVWRFHVWSRYSYFHSDHQHDPLCITWPPHNLIYNLCQYLHTNAPTTYLHPHRYSSFTTNRNVDEDQDMRNFWQIFSSPRFIPALNLSLILLLHPHDF